MMMPKEISRLSMQEDYYTHSIICRESFYYMLPV